MKNFKTIFNETNQGRAWNYYDGIFQKLDLSNADSCKEFIETFMQLSGKADSTIVHKGLKYLYKNDPKRLSHILSVFFLGINLVNDNIYIKERIFEEIKTLIPTEQDSLYKQFSYIWFLLVLFHDLGYYEERDENENESETIDLSSIPRMSHMPIPPVIEDTCENYYNYRNNKDHGIFGGLLFHKNLCELRAIMNQTPHPVLYSGEELDDVFAYIAWIIVAHNIWFLREKLGNEDNIREYKENHIESLILKPDEDYPYHFEEYPLLFFFCLLDSIDPIKQLSLLNNWQVDFNNKERKLCIKTNSRMYAQNILLLNDWLCPIEVFPSLTAREHNHIEDTFNRIDGELLITDETPNWYTIRLNFQNVFQ